MLINGKPAARIIALEEAFLHPKVWEHYPDWLQQRFRLVKPRLMDVGPERIRRMDAAGIDLQVLSHVQPGVQALTDAGLSVALCREVNDWLGEIVRAYPERFAGFAMLPTQSPPDAADELERTVRQHQFKGALVNGHTNGKYLDDRSFSVLLSRAEALDVPIYIHPTDPPPPVIDAYYENYPALIPAWGFLVETGTHLLRMIVSGVFDRHPKLKIIVGHMGELIPYTMARLAQALTFGEWLIRAEAARAAHIAPSSAGMERSLNYYMSRNVFITTSGVFDQPVFECAKAYINIDNILFAVDDPFRDNIEGVDFLRSVNLSAADREKLAHGNAEQILKIPRADGTVTTRSAIGFAANLESLRARIKSRLGRALINALIR